MEPTNKFRDEIENQELSKDDVLNQEQLVLLMEFTNKKELLDADFEHIENCISMNKKYTEQLSQLPDSECKRKAYESAQKTTEELTKSLPKYRLNRVQEIILTTLQSLFPEGET